MRLLYSILLIVFVLPVFAQLKIPVLATTQSRLSVRMGDEFYRNAWVISPKKRPNILQVPITDKQMPVCFIAENDSLFFNVEAGRSYDFAVLLNGKDTAFTRLIGIKHEPAARFNKAYQEAHDKKILVEVPIIYELVNIIIALTPTGRGDSDLVYHNSPYYQQVQKWFRPYINEPIVSRIDSALKNDLYAEIKMDAYAFEYSDHGHIVRSNIYDRISWGAENTLRPYIADLEKFAGKSKFRAFFQKHLPLYKAQTRCYEDSINTTAMVQWLRGNFPNTGYNSFKVIFSPLVFGSQSANWFESDGFKEMQMHINFPYVTPALVKAWSAASVTLRRSQTVFTEMNHSFINPQLDLSLKEGNKDFDQAFEHMDVWGDSTKPARHYTSPKQCFNEYMNWALVSLYFADKAPVNEKERMIRSVGEHIQNGRGFKKFIAFNDYLVQLYVKRPAGTTLAELYPQIIKWFNLNKG